MNLATENVALPRLAATLLVAWLAVLGAAAPALACAAASAGDCCPDGTSAPCPDDGPAACCAAVPILTLTASSPSARVESVKPPDSRPPILPVAALASCLPPASRGELVVSAGPPIADTIPVYLRTLRLRL